MPFELLLPPPWRAQGWKVKIREQERLEPPHVSILWRHRTWRIDLRSRRFLERVPDPNDVPEAVCAAIEANWGRLCTEWDEMYPENPVSSKENRGDR